MAEDGAGSEVSTTIRVTEPLSLTMALRELEREQFVSRSIEAARSGRCTFMSMASRRGDGEEQGAKNLLVALASGEGALRAQASFIAATTFVFEVLAVGFFLRWLVSFLAARTSQDSLLNSLVPATIAAYGCVGSLGGCAGAPLVEGLGGAGAGEW